MHSQAHERMFAQKKKDKFFKAIFQGIFFFLRFLYESLSSTHRLLQCLQKVMFAHKQGTFLDLHISEIGM